jgi:hypothetical protein
MFSKAGLDKPNQIETPQQIRLSARAENRDSSGGTQPVPTRLRWSIAG